MDQLPAFGTEISQLVLPTHAAYEGLLLQNADQIRSVKKETFSYGSLPRQQLDVYHPPKPSIVNGRSAVLIFFYGGGFVRGDRTLAGTADGLVHANIGSFFALKFGYTVVVSDYRLVGSHDAKFPSGGEDVALTVKWVADHQRERFAGPLDLFAMGNSAGAVHLATFMLHASFAETRRSVLASVDCRLRGVTYLSGPLDFERLAAYRADTIQEYFGDKDSRSPVALLKAARQSGSIDFIAAKCRTFILNAQLDPWDEIQSGRDKFIHEWLLIEGDEARDALAVDTMIGHNHISPIFGLGTGVEREEAWGFQVGAFCENLRKFPPS